MLDAQQIQFFTELNAHLTGFTCGVSSTQFVAKAGHVTVAVEPRQNGLFEVSIVANKRSTSIYLTRLSETTKLAAFIREKAMQSGAVLPLVETPSIAAAAAPAHTSAMTGATANSAAVRVLAALYGEAHWTTSSIPNERAAALWEEAREVLRSAGIDIASPAPAQAKSLGEAVAELGIDLTVPQASALIAVEAALAERGASIKIDTPAAQQ